ncbi:uncharacterized protein LOC110980000 [Acanthaster planci]|uniref:Uncharacterized protein LOC110980000 n=1 Tax=Acanthaster planci TaxID=133434 RepID=A0A8B7YFC4_ACAPL|nr:uncharacterized protein LOC110980000 [Acanthaster planci]
MASAATLCRCMQPCVRQHGKNLSGKRSGCGDITLLIPYGLHWSEVTVSCLIGVDIQTGKVVEGDGDVEPSAANIHTVIYKSKGEHGRTGGTAYEGEAKNTWLARNLGDNDFLIMGNHGMLGVGYSLAYVFDSMYYL